MKKCVVSIISTLTGAAIGAGVMSKVANKSVDKVQMKSDKHLALFLLMNQWVRVKQEGKSIVTYFQNKGYKRIAIYGMSYVGETMLLELKDSEIEVVYAIDKKAEGIYTEVDIVSPEEDLEEVDAVIVTPVFFMDEIENMLSEKISCPIISMEDILYEV